MAWVYLIAAIGPVPSVSVLFFYLVSISLLVLTLKRIDIGVSYAVWTGVGTSLIAAIGILWFQEPATTLKVASLVLIIAGVVGLNLGGAVLAGQHDERAEEVTAEQILQAIAA